jgi:hypothetical protein
MQNQNQPAEPSPTPQSGDESRATPGRDRCTTYGCMFHALPGHQSGLCRRHLDEKAANEAAVTRVMTPDPRLLPRSLAAPSRGERIVADNLPLSSGDPLPRWEPIHGSEEYGPPCEPPKACLVADLGEQRWFVCNNNLLWQLFPRLRSDDGYDLLGYPTSGGPVRYFQPHEWVTPIIWNAGDQLPDGTR